MFRKKFLVAFVAFACTHEARADVFLSRTDRHSSATVTADGLGVSWATLGGIVQRAIRSDVAIAPGSGFYYFEARRELAAADYGFGVATAQESLNTNGGGLGGQSCVVSAGNGGLRYNNITTGNLAGTRDTWGFAVDYRGTNPIIYLIMSATVGGPAQYITAVTMNVTAPLYIFLYSRVSSPSLTQTINGGNNLAQRPFAYDPATVLNGRFYRGADGLVLGWPTTPNANRAPTIAIAGGTRSMLLGETITVGATASDPEQGAIAIDWSDSASALTGNGATFAFTPSTLGRHTLTARALDPAAREARATVDVEVVVNPAIDADGDALSHGDETALGTNPGLFDTDGDGLNDGDEARVRNTNPLAIDSDADGVPDGFEVAHGTNPAIADGASDLDGDGASSLAEFQAGTDPNLATSYPGRGVVRLSSTDKHPSLTLTGDGLGVAIGGSFGEVRAARSEVAIQPGTGWYYFEGHREVAAGNFGFGVASASAPLDAAGGSNDQSVGINSLGTIFHGGIQVGSFPDPTNDSYYGIAVDYSGLHPVVYVVLDCVPVRVNHLAVPDGYTCSTTYGTPGTPGGSGLPIRVLSGIVMNNVSGPLYAFAYGEQTTAGIQQTMNFGAAGNFHYPANYVLFNEGVFGAEFLGDGWGPDHRYAGRKQPALQSRVALVKQASTNADIRLSPDALGASYNANQKSSVRANQGMIGEFRYWEAHREITSNNFGQGIMTEYSQINPYCFEPQQPSMSLNSIGGMWRNLVSRPNERFATTASYYGFAVDYRGPRPIVYTIVDDLLVSTITLDVFVPVYPNLYGNPMGNVVVNTANFGSRSFRYNPRTILQSAGIDASALVLGWGVHRTPDPTPTARPEVIVQSISDTVTNIRGTVTIDAIARDTEDGTLTQAITWSDGVNTLATVGGHLVYPVTRGGRIVLRANIVDSAGASAASAVIIQSTDPDDDGDGLTLAEEMAAGTNPSIADTDGDGLSDGAEVHTHLTNPLSQDTDGDSIADGVELANGLNPRSDDIGADLDGDGYGNLEEIRAGSDPRLLSSQPARRFGYLSLTDRHAAVTVSADRLGISIATPQLDHRGVRSDLSVAPGSGLYYVEGHREVAAGNFGFGVGNAAARLDTYAGANLDSVGVNALGFTSYNGVLNPAQFPRDANDTYGLAIDYRGATPTVHVIVRAVAGGPAVLFRSITLSSVTGPVYLILYGTRAVTTLQQTINIGSDPARPFAFDAEAILAAGGVNASGLVRGFSERANGLPVLSISSSPITVVPGTLVTLSATATDRENGDLSSLIAWRDPVSGATGTGASFTFAPVELAVHAVRARIVDSAGAVREATVAVTVADTGGLDPDNDGLVNRDEDTAGTNPNLADTDGDGLRDGLEVHSYGSNPLLIDTDADGLPDGYEALYNLSLVLADAANDLDGDGYSNLEEYLGFTDPANAAAYPGPARTSYLSTTDRHALVTLTADRLGVTYANQPTTIAVRSDVALSPGSGFWYFEGRRLLATANYGFGLATAAVTLVTPAGTNNQSLGVHVLGNVAYNNAIQQRFTGVQDYYGIAVDYRGANPIVHVITSDTLTGPGRLVRSVTMSAVTAPIFIFVYGQRVVNGGLQQTINTGNDLVGHPFHFDPVAILSAAGVSGTAQLNLGWN